MFFFVGCWTFSEPLKHTHMHTTARTKHLFRGLRAGAVGFFRGEEEEEEECSICVPT